MAHHGDDTKRPLPGNHRPIASEHETAEPLGNLDPATPPSLADDEFAEPPIDDEGPEGTCSSGRRTGIVRRALGGSPLPAPGRVLRRRRPAPRTRWLPGTEPAQPHTDWLDLGGGQQVDLAIQTWLGSFSCAAGAEPVERPGKRELRRSESVNEVAAPDPRSLSKPGTPPRALPSMSFACFRQTRPSRSASACAWNRSCG